MASDKVARLEAQQKRHTRIQAELKNSIATAKNQLKYEEMRAAAYWLRSMLTLWIKMPREKSNMDAVNAYAWRMCSGKQKNQKETNPPPAKSLPRRL